tara:strand:- start:1792 stop:1968 length:177 start_codon:yes stop_codon:yes gene_type:complete
LALFLIIKVIARINTSKVFVLNKVKKAKRKERFDTKSMLGINIVGKTNKLESIYINFL